MIKTSKKLKNISDSKTALLIIIDVQNGVLGEEDETYNAETLISNIEGLLKKARDTKTPIIYVQHNEEEQLEPNTKRWQIHPRLTPKPGDLIIQKHHPSSFHDTNLEKELRKLQINRLVICGLQTEWCIDSTVRHAYSLGFDVTLVEDAHSTTDTSTLSAAKVIEHHNRVLGGGFAILKSAKEIDFY